MNPRSIRFRLAAWHAVIFSALFALLGGLLYATVRQYLGDTILETQSRRARQIAETLVAGIPQNGEAYVAKEIPKLYAPELGDRFIRVTRPGGSVLYLSGEPNDRGFDPSAVPPAPGPLFRESSRQVDQADGRSLLVAAYPGAGSYLVEVGTSAEPVARIARRLLVLLVLGIPLVAVVAAVGGYFLAGRALVPVERMAAAAESISQHNLSERLADSQTGDELERLGLSLNRMIARLDDAFSNSKRFVADASHELRTPLTVIQGELEALASDPGASADVRDRAGSMLEEVERLGKIVQKLFALSRLDAGEAQEEWVRLDFASLADGTCEQMQLLADDRRIRIVRDAAEPVYVMGDRARLKQIVVNLVDNAIKYTGPGGSITLGVRSERSEAVLEVADTGVGIPATAVPLVFERFYRVDRGRTGPDTGAGLGLAIVKSIAVAHGGRVEVESFLGSGSRFRIRIPLAPAE